MVNIDLASFNFDISEIVAGAAKLKKEIDDLKEEQRELNAAGESSSEQFVRNAADLKTLNGVYNEHIKFLANANKEVLDQTVRTDALNQVLAQEVTTIRGLREQNKILNDLRNSTNLTTAEGREELQMLNDKLDENNAIIKENVDQYTQQKINVGNYTESILEAFSVTNLMNGGVQGLKDAFAAATTGIIGMTKAAAAFILTPVGAVVAVIAAGFLLVQNALNRSEESTNKLTRALAPLQGIFDALMAILEPVGDILLDVIVKGFEILEASVYTLIDGLSILLDFLGFEDAAASVRDFNKELMDGATNAKNLADAEAELVKVQREARLVQLEYQKDAETLRQIRDDESRSVKERIQANTELGAILEKQLQEELRIAEQALLVANLRIQAEGETSAALDAQASALENIADIEERVNSQRSEQLTNRVALDKAAAQAASEAADRRIKKEEELLELFIQQQGWYARTLEQELELEEQIAQKKLKILEAELRAKKISQEAYAREVLEISQNLARMEAEIAVEAAAREVEAYKRGFEEQMNERRFLSDAVVDEKVSELDRLMFKEAEYAQLRLDQGLINQQEFDDAIFELTEANRLAIAELNKEREEVERQEAIELRALEFEAELEKMLEENATRFEIEQAQVAEQFEVRQDALNNQLEQGLISQELYNAKMEQLTRQRANAEERIEKALAQEKFDIATGLLDAAALVINKESKAGKAIALAKAAMNMYQGISAGVALGFPASIPAVAFATATGGMAIKDILSTKIPNAGGGGDVSGGASPVSSAINLSGQGVNLGSANTNIQNQVNQGASNQEMMEQMAQAVQQGAQAGTQQGSEQGITNLTANRQIMQESEF